MVTPGPAVDGVHCSRVGVCVVAGAVGNWGSRNLVSCGSTAPFSRRVMDARERKAVADAARKAREKANLEELTRMLRV